MKSRRTKDIAMPGICALVLAGALAACGTVDPADDEIVLTNRADFPVIAMIFELEASHLVDPIPTLEVTADDPRVIRSGASRRFRGDDVHGGYERGDDVRLFLYRVSGDEALLDEIVTVTHAELAIRGFRIQIP